MTNPLSQYFRRPAVYLKLPSGGKGYLPETIEFPENRELPVYPMSAIDEITVKTPDALFNGTAVVDMIKSCIPAIKDPWKILSTDVEAILIAIKSASSGDSLDIDSSCPKCTEVSSYSLSLVQLLSNIKASNFDEVLEVGDLKVKFKPLLFTDINNISLSQLELQKKLDEINKLEDLTQKNQANKDVLIQITLMTIEVISKTIEFIQTPNLVVDEHQYILDFLKNCDKNIFNTIKDHNAKLKKDSEIKPIKLVCSNCGHNYEQTVTLNPTDFFG